MVKFSIKIIKITTQTSKSAPSKLILRICQFSPIKLYDLIDFYIYMVIATLISFIHTEFHNDNSTTELVFSMATVA